MIKKIPISSLQLKMYVYDLNCEWTNHPFALREFQVASQEQIDEITKAGIKELYIDTDRGTDVAYVNVDKTDAKPIQCC